MIDLGKLMQAIQRNRRPRGFEAPKGLEVSWIRFVSAYLSRLEREAWREVEPVVRQMTPSTTTDASLLDALVASRARFFDLDGLKARADRIFSQVDTLNRQSFRTLLKRTIGVGLDDLLDDDAARRVVTQSINESIDLIKTVSENHFERFKTTILRGITNGTDFHSLKKQVLGTQSGYPKWKATRIARDQYLKLNGKITEVRQRSIGVTHYFWRAVGDNRTRDSHRDNDGKRFAWNDPPPTGHPGQAIQCRCIADPDLETASGGLIANAAWRKIPRAQFGPRVGG